MSVVTPVPGQTNHNQNAASSATIATTLNGVVAGRCVFVYLFYVNSSSVTSLKDDLGNSAIRAQQFNWAADGSFVEHWYFPNCAGGNRTYTATFSPAASFRTIHVAELQGADPFKPVDPSLSTSSASGSS